MVRPPTFLEVFDSILGTKRVKETLSKSVLSNIQWRGSGIKYTNNEIFLDIVEHLNATVDRTGTTISAEVLGKIQCRCKLSGTPDLVLSFTNSHIINDVSLHPCVRLQKWTNEKCISFIPPDGNFILATYLVGAQHQVKWCK